MQDYLDNSYDMNVTDLDIAIERFNIDIKRIESEYLFESALFDLDSKYYSESEENVQEKKTNKFFEFILNMFTKLKNLIKDMGTAIRNVTKKETLDSETYFNYEIGRANIDYEIKLFLVDNYFNSFVYNDRLLKEMYDDRFVSSLEFLKEFRKKLSEYLDKDITKLNDAKSLVKKSEATYQRSILNKI